MVTRRASNSQLASFGPDGAGDQWASPRQGSRGLKVALSALFMIVLAGIGYVGYLKLLADQPASARPRGTPPGEGTVDRAAATGSPAEDRSAAESGTGAGAAGDDARPGSTPPPGSVESAASAGEPAISGPAGRDEPAAALVITSQPGRARVYIDGASIGRTPLTLEPNNDRHKIAIIEPGYKPHIAEVDGRGKVSVVLEEVTPPNGPAGIKIRCRQKNRYYVTLDGEPTGQLCPTERLGVELGDHTAEIYDPVTDSRRAYKVRVGQTRLSVRVRVD